MGIVPSYCFKEITHGRLHGGNLLYSVQLCSNTSSWPELFACDLWPLAKKFSQLPSVVHGLLHSPKSTFCKNGGYSISKDSNGILTSGASQSPATKTATVKSTTSDFASGKYFWFCFRHRVITLANINIGCQSYSAWYNDQLNLWSETRSTRMGVN